jgi:hypothetical protein
MPLRLASQISSAHKVDSLSTQTWISHKSHKPNQQVSGKAHKGLGISIFVGGTSTLQRREGEIFYTCPQKTNRWN